jgi:hypothetical protein
MWAAIAAAAVAVTPGSYGGGVVPSAAQANAGTRLALVSFRVPASGTEADIYVVTSVDCGRGDVFEVELRVRRQAFTDGGAFEYADNGDDTYDDDGTHKLETSWDFAGAFADGKLAGTLQVRTKRGGRRCKSGTKSEWQARNPAAGTAGAEPLPGTPYFGTTAQIVADHYPAPIVLRTTGDGRAVAGAQWLVSARCQKQRNDLFVNTTPKTAIANRTFERDERFSVRYVEGKVDFRARLGGTFTDAGAHGALRLREMWRARRDAKKVVDRCDSATVSWRAAP